jgi:hypothetical protein
LMLTDFALVWIWRACVWICLFRIGFDR